MYEFLKERRLLPDKSLLARKNLPEQFYYTRKQVFCKAFRRNNLPDRPGAVSKNETILSPFDSICKQQSPCRSRGSEETQRCSNR